MRVSGILLIATFILLSPLSFSCSPEPPVAVIDPVVPESPQVGQTVSFDGSGSFCPPDSGYITEYEWVFPPEAYCIQGEHSANASCKFSPSGQYEVKLYVKSSAGLWSLEPASPNDCWHVNVIVTAAGPTWYVKPDGNDANNGQSWVTAFRTVRVAIDSTVNGDEILLEQGTYHEQINFKGKNIEIRSTNPNDWQIVQNTIIDADRRGSVVVFDGTEISPCKIEGITLQSGAPAGNGLALRLELNETSELTASDSSGKGRDGTLVGAVWTPSGHSEGCLSFDGDDCVEIAGYKGIPGRNSRTVSAWVKTSGSSVTDWMEIICWGDSSKVGGWWNVVLSDQTTAGKWVLRMAALGGYVEGTTQLADGLWHHVAVTLDSDGTPNLDEVRLFVDGKEETLVIPANISINTVTSMDLRIGGQANRYYEGSIDEIRVYSRALSAQEIAGLADLPGPMAWWKLDETSGAIAQDSSSSGFDGTLYGSPSWGTGKNDNGLTFDGIDDYVQPANYPGVLGNTPRTCAFWIKTTQSAADVISWGRTLDEYGQQVLGQKWVINFSNGYLRTMVHGGNLWTYSPSIQDGQWHHIAVVLDNDGSMNVDETKHYVDGVLQSVYSTTAYPVNTVAAEDMTFGQSIVHGGNFFAGQLDEVRIYDRALSEDEVRTMMGECLEAHWKLDNDYNDVANGHDGTPVGDPVFDEGRIDHGIRFNGQRQYIQIQHDSALEVKLPITLMCWFYLKQQNVQAVLMGTNLGSGVYSGANLQINNGLIELKYGDGGGKGLGNRRSKVASISVQETQRWYYVVGVIRGPQDMSIYIDGIDVGGTYSGTGGDIYYSPSGYPLIGSSSFNGKMDDVQIYSRALTAKEIRSEWQEGMGFKRGGGIRGYGANADISHCIIRDNTSEADGGGIWNIDGDITNSFVVDNAAQDAFGGGLAGCDGDIVNCVIASNIASDGGNAGGLYDCNGSITNCTIANNTASGAFGGVQNCSATVTNTILWSNIDSDAGTNTEQTQISGGSPFVNYCCIQDDDPGSGTIPFGSGTGNMDDDPLYASPESGDYHLSPGSPCRNAGDPGGNYLGQLDIDGLVRVQDGRVDVGAYEWQRGIIYVDFMATAGANNGGNWDNAFVYLQDALDVAVSGDQIWVAAGVYCPDKSLLHPEYEDDRSISFCLPENISLYGGFAGTEIALTERDWLSYETILSGDIDEDGILDAGNSYHVVIGADGAVLDGFTISQGVANGSGNDGYGGGILNLQTSPEITRCKIMSNWAYVGGGLFAYESSYTVSGTVFYGNFATDFGGGVAHVGCDQVSLANCVFNYNTAHYYADEYDYSGYGGGIYNENSAGTAIVNCTFYDNWGLVAGGGVLDNISGGTIVKNSILWGDSSSNGMEIALLGSSGSYDLTVSYSDVEGGQAQVYRESGYTLNWGSGNLDTDPLFADPDSMDPDDRDFHLKSAAGRWTDSGWVNDTVTSLCIDAGNPQDAYSSEPSPNGGIINMGCYGNIVEASKSNSVWVSTSGSNNNDGSYISPFRTIAYAIDNKGYEGAVINVVGDNATKIYYENLVIGSSDGKFTLKGVNWPIINGGFNGESVVYLYNVNSDVQIDGFYILNGLAQEGAGMFIQSCSPTIRNCRFAGNYAYPTIAGYYWARGGGMAIEGGSPAIENCDFILNKAEGIGNNDVMDSGSGGGVYTHETTAIIRNCRFGVAVEWFSASSYKNEADTWLEPGSGGVVFGTHTDEIYRVGLDNNPTIEGFVCYQPLSYWSTRNTLPIN